MKLRFFIFSFLILAYSVILGHEVVYGHHTSSTVNCHQASSDCCDHHDDTAGHLPCLVDINPHIGPGSHDLNIELVENGTLFSDIILDFDPQILHVVLQSNSLPLYLPDLGYYNSRESRSNSLRGPPLA